MGNTVNKAEAAAILYQKAEALLKMNLPAKKGLQHSEADVLKLMHEIEVYQIELELQQEELIWAENQAQELGIKVAIEKGDQSLITKTNAIDRKRAEKALAASEIFDVQIQKDLTLLTIRHYTEEKIEELTKGKIIVLEQKTPETIQVLMR